MVEFERRGVPTVAFTAKTFVHDAHRSAASFGLPGLPIAIVPMPFTNQRPEDIHRMAGGAFDQVVAGLTRAVEPPESASRTAVPAELRYQGTDLLGAWDEINRDFLRRGWSDGFPLVAPTDRAGRRCCAGRGGRLTRSSRRSSRASVSRPSRRSPSPP